MKQVTSSEPADNMRVGDTTNKRTSLTRCEARSNVIRIPQPAPQVLRMQRAIMVSERQLVEVVSDAWAAVGHSDYALDLFVRDGRLVRLTRSGDDVETEAIGGDQLFGILARSATWYRSKGGNPVPTNPPRSVVRDMLSSPCPSLRRLDGIQRSPAFSSHGELMARTAYHEGERIWMQLPEDWDALQVPHAPSEEQIATARRLIVEELLADFPFADAASQAHAVAAILLPACRSLIEGPTPLHLFDAPKGGTGKTLLVQAIVQLVAGSDAATLTESSSDGEWRKKLTASLKNGPAYVFIDNVTKPVKSGQLAAALTSRLWKDRLLGHSHMLCAPIRTCWMMSGNNVRLSDEIARRTALIRLDARCERPESRRGFRHDPLLEFAHTNRRDLVEAALTLIQAWIRAGKPSGSKRLGSYEGWSDVIGGVLGVAGIDGFLDNVDELHARADTTMGELRTFIRTWAERFGQRTVGVKDLYRLALDGDQLLDVLGGGNERSRRVRLGRQLGQMRDQVIDGFRVVSAEHDNHGCNKFLLKPTRTAGGADAEEPTDDDIG